MPVRRISILPGLWEGQIAQVQELPGAIEPIRKDVMVKIVICDGCDQGSCKREKGDDRLCARYGLPEITVGLQDGAFKVLPQAILECHGTFLNDRFVKMGCHNILKGGALQFGSVVLMLGDEKAELKGGFVGYEPWNREVVYGDVVLTKVR